MTNTSSSLHTHTIVIGGKTYKTSQSTHSHTVPDALVTPPVTPPSSSWLPAPAGATLLKCTPGIDQSTAYASLFTTGRQIALESNATYLMDYRTQPSGINGWAVYTQGATVRSKGLVLDNGVWVNDAWLRPVQCQDWAVYDGTVIGPASATVAV